MAVALLCVPWAAGAAPPAAGLTQGAIALDNLDHLITQQGDDPASLGLWLMRLQFTADDRVLDRLARWADAPAQTLAQRLQRAQALAAAHRFTEALAELEAAAGPNSNASAQELRSLEAQRASLLVAVGRAQEALPVLQDQALRHPSFTTRCTLARAYAAVGRLDDADRLYAQALDALDSTSPFPLAAVSFALGLMWSEQGDDPARGSAWYRQAVQALPAFAAAQIHLAEWEHEHADPSAALARLEALVQHTDEPEAWALLGTLHQEAGRPELAQAAIHHARQRYEALLARHPLAYADHAAEFYLGVGQNPQQAWAWAQLNLQQRPTRRAYLLAIRAARARGLEGHALALERQMAARHHARAL